MRRRAVNAATAASVGPIATPRTGVVESFDDERGLGVVQDESGRRFSFHATTITDGSRTIAAGTRVEFVVAAGLKGKFEARRVAVR